MATGGRFDDFEVSYERWNDIASGGSDDVGGDCSDSGGLDDSEASRERWNDIATGGSDDVGGDSSDSGGLDDGHASSDRQFLNCMSWNVNGFGDGATNYEAKKKIIDKFSSDIVILTETHCHDGEVIKLHNYESYMNSRVIKRRSGGVCILIKKSLHATVHVEKETSPDEKGRLLAVSVTIQDVNILIIAAYFVSACSKFALKDNRMCKLLLRYLRKHDNYDMCICAGDFNARVGELVELDCHDVVERKPIDKVNDARGKKLIEYISIDDSPCCIVNGRITPTYDGFTSIRERRGKLSQTVIDYVIVPVVHLENCLEFKVHPLEKLNTKFNIQLRPDHSVIEFKISVPKPRAVARLHDGPSSDERSMDPTDDLANMMSHITV